MAIYHVRAFPREKVTASVFWSDLKRDNYFEARLRNKSPAGIYFESAWDCDPGAVIHLQSEDTATLTAKKQSLHARILWKKEMDAPLRYGMGALYLLQNCSLCGSLIKPDRFSFEKSEISLCGSCRTKFNALSEGVLKRGIEQLLSGNVI